MEVDQVAQARWAQARFKDRVSLASWFVAIIAGLWLWSLLLRAVAAA